jgi:DNA-binding MarR family transcriptional regulator
MFDPKTAGQRGAPPAAGKSQNAQAEGITAPVRQLTDLVEQVNRIVYGLGFTAGLNPAQWAALRYFARSAEGQRTVGSLAHHQCVTAPTASETVSALVRKGYVTRQPSATDKRSHILALTSEGELLLGADPLLEVAAVINQLNEDQRAGLNDALDVIARQLLLRRKALRERD